MPRTPPIGSFSVIQSSSADHRFWVGRCRRETPFSYRQEKQKQICNSTKSHKDWHVCLVLGNLPPFCVRIDVWLNKKDACTFAGACKPASCFGLLQSSPFPKKANYRYNMCIYIYMHVIVCLSAYLHMYHTYPCIYTYIPSHQLTWNCKNALSKRKVVFLGRVCVGFGEPPFGWS